MTVRPTSGHSANFRPDPNAKNSDGRLFSAVFDRNHPAILDAVDRFIGELSGPALEIGSGTGQHLAQLLLRFPNLQWVGSEPDEIHPTSIDAWASFQNAGTKPAINIDASSDWGTGYAAQFSAIISMNVIHIAPPSVLAGILAGASIALKPGGVLMFYGPFKEGGQHTGDGNRIFDERLRRDNPAWGLRDIDEINDQATRCGLKPSNLVEMPANNRLLVLTKPTP
jgi:SAM-dependent methyltransferase